MAKKQVEKPQREVTRRQLSRRQQHQKRQRIIFGAGILIIVIVLAIVGVGIYVTQYLPNKPLHETVIEVNGTKFDMEYYIKMLEYMVLQYQYYGISITTDMLSYLTSSAEQSIEQSELIRQAAKELGISVSDEEINETLADKGYDPQVIEEYRDVFRTQMLVQKLTDEYFEEEVPKFAEQRHIWAMFLESESQADEVKDRLEAGEDFATLAGELSLDTTCKEKEGDLGWRPEGVLSQIVDSSVLEENAFSCEVGVLSQSIYEEEKTKAVGYWLIEVLERTGVEELTQEEEQTQEEQPTQEEEQPTQEEQPVSAKVKVMLLSSEQEANEVRARLEAGEDFATLAGELSQHSASKENGGEFEVTAKGTVSSAFDDFVFDPEVELGTLSQPIRDEEISTTGGYWLTKVTEVDENREIAEEDRDVLKSNALSAWVNALWDDPDNNIVSYLDDEKTNWAISYVMTGGL